MEQDKDMVLPSSNKEKSHCENCDKETTSYRVAMTALDYETGHLDSVCSECDYFKL